MKRVRDSACVYVYGADELVPIETLVVARAVLEPLVQGCGGVLVLRARSGDAADAFITQAQWAQRATQRWYHYDGATRKFHIALATLRETRDAATAADRPCDHRAERLWWYLADGAPSAEGSDAVRTVTEWTALVLFQTALLASRRSTRDETHARLQMLIADAAPPAYASMVPAFVRSVVVAGGKPVDAVASTPDAIIAFADCETALCPGIGNWLAAENALISVCAACPSCCASLAGFLGLGPVACSDSVERVPLALRAALAPSDCGDAVWEDAEDGGLFTTLRGAVTRTARVRLSDAVRDLVWRVYSETRIGSHGTDESTATLRVATPGPAALAALAERHRTPRVEALLVRDQYAWLSAAMRAAQNVDAVPVRSASSTSLAEWREGLQRRHRSVATSVADIEELAADGTLPPCMEQLVQKARREGVVRNNRARMTLSFWLAELGLDEAGVARLLRLADGGNTSEMIARFRNAQSKIRSVGASAGGGRPQSIGCVSTMGCGPDSGVTCPVRDELGTPDRLAVQMACTKKISGGGTPTYAVSHPLDFIVLALDARFPPPMK